jgi:phospholipid/cholesterol/gamma-HCH transport system permease protein
MSAGSLGSRASAPLAGVGDRVLDGLEALGAFARLAGATARALAAPRFPWREALRQFESIGARSTTIVLLTALFTGMVLALQTGYALERFGAKLYVGSGVGL